MAGCDHTGTGRRAHCVDGDSDEWRSAAADLPGACANAWSPDGQSFYVQIQPSPQPGRMAILTVSGETGLPDLPPGGIETADQALSLRGVRVVGRGFVIPGPDPGTYAYINPTVHRNLFRIPAPR